MKTADVLSTVAWGMEHFGSVLTSRSLPRRDVMKAVDQGFVKSVGLVEQCDADGFYMNNRASREGFVLTDAGKREVDLHTLKNYPEGQDVEVIKDCMTKGKRGVVLRTEDKKLVVDFFAGWIGYYFPTELKLLA